MGNYHIIHQDKEYRRTAPPRNGVAVQIPGEWEFHYKIKNGQNWHPVKSLVIRGELDRRLAREMDA